MNKMFTYMTNDINFSKKYLKLFAFILIANLLINGSGLFMPGLNHKTNLFLYYSMLILGFVIMFVPYGYSIELLKTVMNNDKNTINLPSIDPKINFISGLNVVLAGSLLIFALFFILFILGIINNFTTNLLFGIIPNVLFVLTLLILFMTSFFGIAMCCNYVKRPSYFNFIDIKSAADVINKNTANYFKYYIITAAVAAVTYMLASLTAQILTHFGYIGLVLYAIIVSVIWTYVTFVLAYIFTKAVE